jgi:signal transduction histidine kinase
MLSLRGQWLGSAIVLGVLVLGAAAALMGITSHMERGSGRLWQASESVRAAEELEVALLQHSRERRLLDLTGQPVHGQAMKASEDQLHQWLARAREQVGSDEEASLLSRLEAELAAYLEAVRAEREGRADMGRQEASSASSASIERSLALSERLVDLNVADARSTLEQIQRWNQWADLIGLGTALVLLAGVAAVLWSFQRRVYGPLQGISQVLATFQPGRTHPPVIEQGTAELRDIVRGFNAMAARLERQRDVQLAFLAAVAHDLRNPLQALRLAVSGSRAEASPRSQEVVRRQVERLERMVEDLLDTARVEAGQLDLRLGEHDLGELVRESVELHRPVSARHALEVRLPEGPVPLVCDATRVTQVLNNLLSNAIKYSPDGGAVRVGLEQERDGASLAVSDPGIGIPEAELQSIFEPFRRSSRTRGAMPGVGLGLSVSRRIVEAHGGRMEVASREGQGTTFRVWLPQAPSADAPAPRALTAGPAAGEAAGTPREPSPG